MNLGSLYCLEVDALQKCLPNRCAGLSACIGAGAVSGLAGLAAHSWACSFPVKALRSIEQWSAPFELASTPLSLYPRGPRDKSLTDGSFIKWGYYSVHQPVWHLARLERSEIHRQLELIGVCL